MQNKINEITSALYWRYGAKLFANKPLEAEAMDSIIESARMAPGAYGLQPYRIIRVKDAAVREELKAAAYGQAKVTDSPELLVLCRRTDINEGFINEYVNNVASTRGIDIAHLSQFADMMKGDILSRDASNIEGWAGRQAYIALGMMLETAAVIGVDAGPMEGFDNGKVDEILGLGELNLASVCMISLGYRDDSDEYAKHIKVRADKASFIIEK